MFQQFMDKCGKLYFLSENDALVKIIEREALKNNWFGKTYQCEKCKYWHIATLDKETTATTEKGIIKKDIVDKGVVDELKKQQRKIEIAEEKAADARFKETYKNASPVREMIKVMDRREGKISQQSSPKTLAKTVEGSRSVLDLGSYNTSISSLLDSDTLNKLKNL